ncbi:hypothetical protein M9H77_02766 [Catharanthus roseus]|uniref:Uncharacterized protein n=1 Tax=Catharanthus roseus TaxID=4058 RepID=A0ACC0C9T8_CATRO|nr:hypothetical protein M9H77_02766 [Catharanthus roseus]
MRCSCAKFKNKKFIKADGVKDHLLWWDFVPCYHNWTGHGEKIWPHDEGRVLAERSGTIRSNVGVENTRSIPNEMNSYCEIIIDAEGPNFVHHEEPPNSMAKKFFDMLKAVETTLVEGDDKHPMLFACAELLYIKTKNQWTRKSYDDVCAFIKKHLLPGNNMVEDWMQSRN